MNYVFMTDTDSDLPFELQQKYNIPLVYMPYSIGGQEYFSELDKPGYLEDFYNRMRNGEVSITSSLSTQSYLEYFEPYLKDGKDILFLAFSAQLSCTFEHILEAREKLLKKYSGRKFEVVNTYSISLPQTILILRAHEMYRAGASIDEIVNWIIENRLKSQVYFLVDDLVYFKRGGRVSGLAAFMGTLLSLKPIITLNREGKLQAVEKAKGRKKAIRSIISLTKENIENPQDQQIIILQADCMKEAEELKELIKNEIPNAKSIRICAIGPVIGSHSGPGTLGIAFMGKERPY